VRRVPTTFRPHAADRGGDAPVARLVALDLDGTLLRSDGSVSTRTRRALKRFTDVVLVSARPPYSVAAVAADLGLVGHAICLNGALTYDLERESVVRHHAIPAEVAGRVVAALRESAPGVAFGFEHELRFSHEPAYVPDHPTEPETIADALALAANPVTKLVARHGTVSLEELVEHARRICGSDAHVTTSGGPFVEIMAAGVTKALALAALAEERGFAARDVVAFGDMPTDVPMLEWAGLGVAVANAHPDALAAADRITASNDEDGVALVLESLDES